MCVLGASCRGGRLGISTVSWGPRFAAASHDYDRLLAHHLPAFNRAEAGLPPLSLLSPHLTPGTTPGATPGATPGGRMLITPATGLSVGVTPMTMASPPITPGSELAVAAGASSGVGAAAADGAGGGTVVAAVAMAPFADDEQRSPKRQCVGT